LLGTIEKWSVFVKPYGLDSAIPVDIAEGLAMHRPSNMSDWAVAKLLRKRQAWWMREVLF